LVFEDARQMRDFVSVHDVVQANLLALDHSGANGMAFNIGSGNPITIGDVARQMTRSMGSSIPAEITGKYRAGDIRHCFADISAAQRVLGYTPCHRFADGIADLVEWLRSQTADDKAAQMVHELTAYGLTA
jgi:dTDP-L-rhamnose 4-epimerase